jgi:hypothetical protein
MHGPIKVKSPNNTSKWQMGFNSAFIGLKEREEIGWIVTGLICCWIWTVGGSCESGNEPSGSIKCETCRDYLRRTLHDGVNVRRYKIYFT